jgi:hypothetical protein
VFHVEQTVAGRDLLRLTILSDRRFRTSTTRTTVRAQRAFGEADAGRVDAHLAALAGDVVASRYRQPRMPAAAPWPSRRCLFHVEHITCGWRPRWCGGGNFGRSRLRGQPADCSSRRLPRSVPRGTAKPACRDTAARKRARPDDHQSPFCRQQSAYEPSTAEPVATRSTGPPCQPRGRLVLTAGVELGRHLDCGERHTTSQLRMRWCGLSG